MTTATKKSIINDFTQAELNDLFRYVKSTGKLYWKPRIGNDRHTKAFNKRFARKEAGWENPKSGYTMIYINGRPQMAHRLIWALVNGPTPLCIDHINGDKTDNRLVNLRTATVSDNACNRGKTVKNQSGFKGVYKHKGRFIAQIAHKSKNHNLGIYDTAELAHAAYAGAAKILHGSFARAQ